MAGMTTFAFLIFPELTQLDFTGPYEVVSRCPGATVHVAWKNTDPVRTEHGLMLQPTIALTDIAQADVLCVPGGFGVNALLEDEEVLGHVRRLASTASYVTSVSAGALVLGAAGLLQGRRATTHWAALDLLPLFGATPVNERVVQDGPVITGGGVTAGIDFGLQLVGRLHGDAVAQAIQLVMEYRPAPPYASGHPDEASDEVIALVRARLGARRGEREAAAKRAAERLRR